MLEESWLELKRPKLAKVQVHRAILRFWLKSCIFTVGTGWLCAPRWFLWLIWQMVMYEITQTHVYLVFWVLILHINSCAISPNLRNMTHIWPHYLPVNFHINFVASFDSQTEGSRIFISHECCRKLATSHGKWPESSHDKSREGKNLAILCQPAVASKMKAGWKCKPRLVSSAEAKAAIMEIPGLPKREQPAGQSACPRRLIHQHTHRRGICRQPWQAGGRRRRWASSRKNQEMQGTCP